MLLTDRQDWADLFPQFAQPGTGAGAWLNYERLGFN